MAWHSGGSGGGERGVDGMYAVVKPPSTDSRRSPIAVSRPGADSERQKPIAMGTLGGVIGRLDHGSYAQPANSALCVVLWAVQEISILLDICLQKRVPIPTLYRYGNL